MEKSKKLQRKAYKLLAKNLIVLAVLIAVTVVGVRSWFTTTASADASGVAVAIDKPQGLEVAIVDPTVTVPTNATTLNTWLGNLSWSAEKIELTADNYNWISGLNLKEITGDGINLIRPPLYQLSSVAAVNTGAEATNWSASNIKTTPNVEYLSFDVYIRTTSANQKATLESSTYFGPLDPNASLGSSVAGWSANSVIGACRMAILNNTNTSRNLLWVPAPHLYFDGTNLSTTMTNVNNTNGLNTMDGFGSTITINSDGTYNHGYYNANKTRTLLTRASGAVTSNLYTDYGASPDYLLHKDVNLATLNSTFTKNSTTYYYSKCRVNVWIEGEDPESRAAQVGGEFKINLSLRMDSAS